MSQAITRISYTHDAMIDLIIARPRISNGELAEVFGYTAAWVSLVKSSDAFKARLAARRGEIVDPTLVASLEERIRGVAERAVEVLSDKLAMPSNLIPDSLAIRAAEFGAKSLGLGTVPPAAPPDDSRLERLAERLLALQAQQSPPKPLEFEDAQVREVPADSRVAA